MKIFLLDKNIYPRESILNLCYKHVKISNNNNCHLLNAYLYKKYLISSLKQFYAVDFNVALNFQMKKSGLETIIQVLETSFEPKQSDTRAHVSSSYTFRVMGKTELIQLSFYIFSKWSFCFYFLFKFLITKPYIFNIEVQASKKEQKYFTHSVVLVANTSVLILSDIYSSIIYTYTYVSCQLFSLNDISMVMDKYLQWFCFCFLGDEIFYIKTLYSFSDSSNCNYRLLKVGTVISW